MSRTRNPRDRAEKPDTVVRRKGASAKVGADDLSDTGVRAEAFPADVTDRPALHAALTAAEERLGPIDIYCGIA